MSRPRSSHREFPHVSRFLEEKITRRRKEMGLSQTALAERAGVTRNCIQQMECHEHLPLPSTMFRLIKALEFSEKETAEFWVEIDAAYAQDRTLKETASEACEV
ncbi:MAG: helix-turn-helix transcriptional regulator [Oscillospiraceae bacterium]|nr:helix-turn-helix transcriptional regulator [Oscillospiraceae bacterium]